MSAPSEFQALLLDLWADLHSVNILWQLGVLAACIAAGWLLSSRYDLRVRSHAPLDATQALGIGGMQRLMFPVTALLLVLVARAALGYWQSTHLLKVAATLLLAMALVRLAIYVMRHTFAPSAWLRSSERWISWLVWLGVATYLTGLWPPLSEALHDIGFKVGDHRFSLLLVLQGTVSVIATLLIALWLGRIAENRLMRATTLQVNLRVMFSKLVQVVLLLGALLVALPAVGIDLTVLSVFGGMLGVGIGFGLQKIAANYISGFIILLDRSIRIGNMIAVDNHRGQVTQITTRYTVLRALTGVESIVPNEVLVSSVVQNESYTDPKVRIAVAVQVGYGSDAERAMQIMVEAGECQPRVLKDPSPVAAMVSFGDNGINLELGLWIADPQEGTLGIRSEINREILRRFREEGIEIPFPQRDVRLINPPSNAKSQ